MTQKVHVNREPAESEVAGTNEGFSWGSLWLAGDASQPKKRAKLQALSWLSEFWRKGGCTPRVPKTPPPCNSKKPPKSKGHLKVTAARKTNLCM